MKRCLSNFLNFAPYVIIFILLTTLLGSCAKKSDVFPDVGENIASPTAIILDVAANRLYLVNSNDKVLYDSTQGNFQVYDITNPLAPTLVNTAQTLSFSGQVYLDTVNKLAWVPNRYTADSQATTDRLYKFNLDEASASFLSFTESALSRDAYAIQCCYPASRVWITTSMQELQYVDLNGDLTAGAISLLTTLDNGGQITHAESSYEVLKNNQAFLTRQWGGIMVVNLDEAGATNSVPVDYWISDIEVPRGLGLDSNLLYVVGEGNINDVWTPYLLILDTASLDSTTTNTNTAVIDKEDDGLLQATIQVGNSPQEVLLTTQYAFVTNQADDTVSVIDKGARAVVATIAVGDEPITMALYTTPAGVEQYVYVGNISANTLSVIDIPTLSVVATWPQ